MSLSPDFFAVSLDSQAPHPLTLVIFTDSILYTSSGRFHPLPWPEHKQTYIIETFFNRGSWSEPQNAECNPSACFLSSPEEN